MSSFIVSHGKETVSRLQNFYSDKYGVDNLIMIKDSKQVPSCRKAFPTPGLSRVQPLA